MARRIAIPLALAAVLFLLWQGFILYDNQFRSGRMRETPAVRPPEEPLLRMEAGLVPVDGGETVYRMTPASELMPGLELGSPAEIASGKALYFSYCAQCHGKNHDGNGTVGQSFHPLPGDLRGEKVQSLAPGILFHEISYGIPGGRQPALASTIRPGDRWRIVAYVRSLGVRP